MPNWCENYLVISGPREEIINFVVKSRGTCEQDGEIEEQPLCLDSLIPMPEELKATESPSRKPKKELIKKYGADNWYDWRISKWGTKWDVTNVTSDVDGLFHISKEKEDIRKVGYSFDTAWSPPEPAIIEIGKMFQKLTLKLKYWEAGSGFRGILIVKGEKIIKDATYTYSGSKGG